MKFWRKAKGAVSIFLVIILVPMLTCSSLFVDAGKIRLAKAMAEAAGDLTLNTALTNYDTKLKELYGLMATAQDMDDLFSRLEGYYRTCITSSGVSEEDAETYVQQIMAQLGMVAASDNTADIMNMQLVDFHVQKYGETDLANAALMEKQIVDFMKYRAPINTGLSFLSSLKSFSTLSKQTELVEKRQDYYKAQQTVMENLKSAWSEIAAYNGNKIVQDDTYLTGMGPAMDGVGQQYHEFGKRTIMSLYQKYPPIKQYPFSITVGRITEHPYDIEEEAYTDEEVQVWTIVYGNDSYYPYQSPYFSNPYQKNNLPKLEDLKNAVSGFSGAYENAELKEAPPRDAGYYDLQFMAQKKGEIEAYVSANINLYLSYQKLENVLLWIKGYDLDGVDIRDDDNQRITSDSLLNEELAIGSKTQTIRKWLADLKPDNQYEAHLYDLKDNGESYNTSANRAVDQYDAAFIIDETGGVSIANAINEIYQTVDGYMTDLNNAVSHLEKAIGYLNTAISQLTGDVANAKSAWGTLADDSEISGTTMAKQDKAEIGQLDTYLNEENIQKLITRLENVKADLSNVKAELEKYQFADVFIGKIDTYDNAAGGDATMGIEQAAGKKWSDLNRLSMVEEAVRREAEARSVDAWRSGNIKTDWVHQSMHQPNLLEDKVSMYTYLSSHFAGAQPAADGKPNDAEPQTEDEENGKGLLNSIKSTAQTAADGEAGGADAGQASEKGGDIKGSDYAANSALPSASPSSGGGSVSFASEKNTNVDSAAGSASQSLGNLFSADFLGAISAMGEDLRDKLYVSDYVMSMFSYDTIEKEYRDDNGNKVSEVPAGAILSLTKNDISSTNNYAYGSEVEYIVFGGSKGENLTKAYASIYAIRFGFNLVYAFSNSEIRESALAIATPVSAATLGIVPVPLIQAVVIVAIACCESALDLITIRDGDKVPLYKSKDTWVCSISGLTNAAKNKIAAVAGDLVKDAASDAIDYGVDELNKLLDMSSEQLSEMIQDGGEKVGQTAEDAYDKIITDNANAAIQQLTTLVNSAVEKTFCLEGNETYEGKKAEARQWIVQKLQEWGNTQQGDDLASKTKRTAVDILVSNSGCIDRLFDAVEKTAMNSGAGQAIGNVLDDVSNVESGVASVGTEIMQRIEEVRKEIRSKIDAGAGGLIQAKNEMVNKVKDAAGDGADKLKNTINGQIDGMFGTGGNGDASTASGSFFSFGYSDYLRLFLLISLYAGEEGVVLRTADVIQVNMNHIQNITSFRLSESEVYIAMSATMEVKPTLLALPLFADVKKNPVNNSNWYTITYEGIAGY